jgi:uncharacterized protein YfdQ (DUF2303 family)
MDEVTEVKVLSNFVDSILTAGRKTAEIKQVPREEGVEETTVLVPNGFNLQTIQNELERPTRKRGSRTFTAVESFNSYVSKHKDFNETIIIADEERGQIKAILNDHADKKAGYGDHTAFLNLGFSKQYDTWFRNQKGNRNDHFDQEDLAMFLEENRSDFMCGKIEGDDNKEIENISAQELARMILDLKVTAQEKLSSKFDPQSGRQILHYENEEVGQKNFSPPPQFVLAIPIYKSGDLFQVTIKLFHRTQGGTARFWYLIDQIEKLKERAFEKICKRVTDGNMSEGFDSESTYGGTLVDVLRGVI